jgi:hypothetical protein
MVALGLALVLTVAALEVGTGGQVGFVFDVVFVAVCLLLALLVRPEDFFTVGVLPPLIMLAVFMLLAASRPVAIADRHDSMLQAVVTGLSHHAVALGIGYAVCLCCLAIRDRVLSGR